METQRLWTRGKPVGKTEKSAPTNHSSARTQSRAFQSHEVELGILLCLLWQWRTPGQQLNARRSWGIRKGANACKSKMSCRFVPQATSHVNLPNSRGAWSKNRRLKHDSTRYLVSRSFSLSERNLWNRAYTPGGFGADQLPEVPSPIAAQATRMCRLRWQTLHEWHEAGCNLDGSDLTTKVYEYDVCTKERASRYASDTMGTPWAGLLAGNATAYYEQLCALDVLDLADSPTGDQREVYREFRKQLTRDQQGRWSPSSSE